jgi:hypothetical protein
MLYTAGFRVSETINTILSQQSNQTAWDAKTNFSSNPKGTTVDELFQEVLSNSRIGKVKPWLQNELILSVISKLSDEEIRLEYWQRASRIDELVLATLSEADSQQN